MGAFSRKPVQPPRRRADSTRVGARDASVQDKTPLFQRNRTLTGSVSSSVRSANEQRAQLKSGRIQAHELVYTRRKIRGLFALTIAAASVLLFVVLQFTANVAIVTPGGSVQGDASRYAKSIEGYLKFRPFERIRLFMNNQNLSEHVRRDTPEVSAVRVSGGGGFATSVFEVQLRKPLASWTIRDQQYFVDDKGVSFEVNGYDSPLIHIIDESGIPVESGSAIASNRFLGYVGRTIGALREQGVSVEKVAIPPATTRQISITIKGRDWPLLMSIDRPVVGQAEDASQVLRYIDSKGIQPQYVDVRVSRKAYYKE